MDYYAFKLENVTFSEKPARKSLIWMKHKPTSTDQGLFDRPKSEPEGLKNRKRGSCGTIPVYIVPGARHIDLYDRTDMIPLDKL